MSPLTSVYHTHNANQDFTHTTPFRERLLTQPTSPQIAYPHYSRRHGDEKIRIRRPAALDKAQPLLRVQTKTTLQIMLGGKKTAGMEPMGMGE